MTGIAVVASRRDAQFSQAVHAGLQAAGHAVVLTEILPKEPATQVVLIWSATLEAAHVIDAQALIGLWSEGRLLVVRRDATPLPLGLRDLPSLGPDKSAAQVCASLPVAETSGKSSPRRWPAAAALVVLVFFGGAAYYYFAADMRQRQAAALSALESAAKAADELKLAQAKQLEALKALEQARAAEVAARQSGDTAKLKAAHETAQRAETEAAKQAELVKQREAVASLAAEKAKEASPASRRAEVAKAAPKQESAVVAEAPKASKPLVVEVPKAEVPKADAPRAGVASKTMSRSERERLADEEAAKKALASAGKAGQKDEPQVVASAAPSAQSAAPAKPGGSEIETLYQQALALEQEGNAPQAIRVYRRAARAGSSKAAKRLGEIFDRGAPGVPRDYAESLQWYETARQLGEQIETARARNGGGRPVAVFPAPAPAPVPKPTEPVARPYSPPPPKPAIAPPSAPTVAPVQEPSKAVAPAPAADVPKEVKPAPLPEVSPAPAAAWTGWHYALVAAIVLLVLVFAWRRRRRDLVAELPQPQAARTETQPAADAKTLFVSYSHKDRPRVEPIVSAIEAMGRRVWMDRTDITGQTGWAGQIVRAIRECRAVVLMASPNSYGSDQVVRELYLAMNHKKTIVPIEIEPADMPDELQYILAPFQHHRLSGGETREVLGRALAAV